MIQNPTPPDLNANFAVVLGSGESALTTGSSVVFRLKEAVTLTGIELSTLGGTGSCVLDIWADTYANLNPTVADTITASAKPTISSAIKYQDNTLTGWTKTFAAGTYFLVKIDSVSTFTQITLNFLATRA